MEFHISRAVREKLDLTDLLFSYTGNVVFGNLSASRRLAAQLNELHAAEAGVTGQKPDAKALAESTVNAGALFAMGLIDELSHAMVARYRAEVDPAVLTDALAWLSARLGTAETEKLLRTFADRFPNVAVFTGSVRLEDWLAGTTDGLPNREAALEELLLLWLANANPAFKPFHELFADAPLTEGTAYKDATGTLPGYFETRPPLSPEVGTLLQALMAPMLASPDSLTGQLDFIRERWAPILGDAVKRVLLAIDTIHEEDVAIWMRFNPAAPDSFRHGEPGRNTHGFRGDEYIGFDEYELGPDGKPLLGPDGRPRRRYAADHQAPLNEYEAFSQDQDWMPTVVLMAKSTYVWLEQLSKKYGRHIHRLDHIPDEELRLMAERGMTGLWLIGLWERSVASRTIKRLRGHDDAVASAYSLKDYGIAEDLGGNAAYEVLRERAARFGLRLASDMVPNHMGIDSTWVIEHPDWFISRPESPFPSYSFNGPDLSTDPRVEIKIEDHYFDQTDAAVVFRLHHFRDGATRFMYHGNDGTTFAWNDTAQLDYSKALVREQVIQTIFHVARLFPIIRFDAAMVLAKRHVQRLWFPLPGVGGSIPSRAENAMSQEEFDALMPAEFWREVVDRVAAEVPGTLLLAEAFWLLEGYFVRTLGMHRVYNSAFMNMLRDEENAKYRSYLKKTIEFDPDILGRYVNFMSNPDERTAIDQFGDGDKFFGSATLLATLPGLPMFAHGQLEGFTERYGMEFKRAKQDETPKDWLIERHQREIAPLLHNRELFAGSANFTMYDFWTENGTVDENVFAYSNRAGGQSALILYNNVYGSTRGTVHVSAGYMDKGSGEIRQRSLSDGLGLTGDHRYVITWRDTVRRLEYLRRATDLAGQGLTVSLQGYGYLVLQGWRALESTAAEPWDRLSDMLNGAGVPSVREAMTRIRLQPLSDAIRQTLSAANLEAFREGSRHTASGKAAAAATLTPEAHVIDPRAGHTPDAHDAAHSAAKLAAKAPAKKGKKASKAVIEALVHHEAEIAIAPHTPANGNGTHVPAPAPAIVPDPRVAPFMAARDQLLRELRKLMPELHLPEPAVEDRIEPLAASALHLSTLRAGQPASRWLPDAHSAPGSWAPVLSYVALRSLLGSDDPVRLFDQLSLRGPIAEALGGAGFTGEDAWRAAALVRLLLLPETGLDSIRSERLWSEPDVRWFADVSAYDGRTYVNKECFEQLVDWLSVPALLAAGRPDLPETAAHEAREAMAAAVREMASAGYDLGRFLELDPAQAGALDEEPAAAAR